MRLLVLKCNYVKVSLRHFCAAGFLVQIAFTFPANAKTDAELAGVLSVVPGLGQLANGQVLEGAAWFAAVAGAYSLKKPGLGFDLWMYNAYDAYRDAGPTNGRYAKNTALENWIGVFNPTNFLDPIGAPMLTFYGMLPGLAKYNGKNLSPFKALSTSTIGPGEESLFRGFLFPAISNVAGSKIVGAVASSIMFGLIHTQYGPGGKLVVGLFGLAACLQVDLDKYDLRKAMFMHSWVDFFLLPKHVGPLEKPPTKDNLDNSTSIGMNLHFDFAP